MIVGREERLVRMLEELIRVIEGTSDGIMLQCLCTVYVWEEESCKFEGCQKERWGAGVETQKNVRGEVGGWGRVPFNEPYAPSLSTICDGA